MPWNYILAAVFAVGMFAWLFWPSISKLRLPRLSPAPALDEQEADIEAIGGGEMADVAALYRLKARFVSLKCKEGQDAMAVAATHFFHEEGHA